MPRSKVIAYSLGDVANNLTFMMTSMFLTVYMTEIVGLSAGVAGLVYGLTKIWAGVADLIAGQTVDRVNTRFGHLRPWLLMGSTPLVIVFVLLFSVPAGLNPTMTLVWIVLLDAAFQLAYSFTNIPYGSLSAAMTQDPVDRSKLSGARSIASAITGVALTIFIAPQFKDTAADGIRLRFTLIMIALAVVALVLYFICFVNARENVPRGTGKISFKSTFAMLRKNRPLLILCSGAFFLLGAIFTANAIGMYVAIYILGNASWMSWLMAAQTVGTIAIASLVPTITVRFGKRYGYVLSGIILALGYVLVFLMPENNLVIAIVAWLLIGIGTGGTNSLMFSMQADTVDYGEYVSGIRAEGGSYSILSFIRKCGQGLGGWLGLFVMGLFGYVSGAHEQTEEAIRGIHVAAGVVPAVLAVIAIVIMLAYPLSGEAHENVIAQLNERRTQDSVASTAGVDRARVISEQKGDGRTTLLRKPGGVNPPIVTIFGQRGSGATSISPMVAQMLGVPYIEQKFSSAELAQVDESQLISDSGFDRWLRAVSYSGSQETDLAVATELSANHKAAQTNTREVLEKVSNGGVILGRNGALVLGRAVGTMHIRLIAPEDKRAERVEYQTGLDRSAALAQCRMEDRIRAEMAHKLYRFDPNQDEYYDLTINTASVTYKQVAETIVALYRSKYPDNIAAAPQEPASIDALADPENEPNREEKARGTEPGTAAPPVDVDVTDADPTSPEADR
ncbi:MFS transporter [Corynebacterium tapiri]|uniref:MFS transporter n=2 Tax=Corynebacterium tapiri TaxID=1448266 RepID=A0A5C4U2X8_9CORY|nr:MFS transporter [Corynebacterium tapiri]